MADNWIAGAVNPAHKGLLHRKLGVPEGQTIPNGKLKKAEHSHSPKLAKEANLAQTLKAMSRKYGGGCAKGE